MEKSETIGICKAIINETAGANPIPKGLISIQRVGRGIHGFLKIRFLSGVELPGKCGERKIRKPVTQLQWTAAGNLLAGIIFWYIVCMEYWGKSMDTLPPKKKC